MEAEEMDVVDEAPKSKAARPASELDAAARRHGLALKHLAGMAYNPLTRRAHITPDVSVNYLAHFEKR